MEICFKYKAYRALFATLHEKGVVDGSIKRSVWGIICSQDHTVSNASEYADRARQKHPNMIFCISQNLKFKKINFS